VKAHNLDFTTGVHDDERLVAFIAAKADKLQESDDWPDDSAPARFLAAHDACPVCSGLISGGAELTQRADLEKAHRCAFWYGRVIYAKEHQDNTGDDEYKRYVDARTGAYTSLLANSCAPSRPGGVRV